MLGILLRPDNVPLTRELIDEARQATLGADAPPPCLDGLDADTLLARVQVEGPLLTRWATHTQLSYPTVHDEVLLAHCAERIEREVGGDAWLEHFLWLDGWLETLSEDPAFAAERLWIIARATGVEVRPRRPLNPSSKPSLALNRPPVLSLHKGGTTHATLLDSIFSGPDAGRGSGGLWR